MVLTLEGIGQNNSPRKKDVKLSVITGELTVQVPVKLTAGSLPNDGDHFFSNFYSLVNASCGGEVTFFELECSGITFQDLFSKQMIMF